MTVGTQYGYNRRNLNSNPYTIPVKHQQPPYNPHNNGMSSLVPTLSRDFVSRRISEGETGRLKEELKCEACGKGYKHILSLAKHLWEHTPEWNVTKKLLISKHQQVQLLEAASILVGMNDKDGDDNDAVLMLLPPSLMMSARRLRINLVSNGMNSDGYESAKYRRSYSVLQYPPSEGPRIHDMPAGFVGGYFDVREPIPRSRRGSEFAYPLESAVVFSPSPSVKLDSPSDDLDDEVVGRME